MRIVWRICILMLVCKGLMHQHTQQPVCNESWDEISNQETKQKASTLTPMSDEDRISIYNINTISTR